MIFKTDKSEILDYLQDASNFRGDCEGVYFPENETEVSNILKECNASGKRVTISGNGTGLTGGRVPENGVVISTSRMNSLVEINEDEMYAIVQPGAVLRDFQEAVESKGLFYPPDPTERDCFIGATVANNSSGAKTFKYGPTRDYVLALKVILANGDSVTLERGKMIAENHKLTLSTDSGKRIDLQVPEYDMPATKNSAGYYSKPDVDAIDLFIGSEGTLGVITEIKLKLLKLPTNVLSSIIFFDIEANAFDFVLETSTVSGNNRAANKNDAINALGIEFFDANALEFMKEDYPQIPAGTQAAIWFEQEITNETEEPVLDQWMELIEKHGGDLETAWIATNEADRNHFKDFRHAVAWKVTEYLARENVRKVGTDTAVPGESFVDYYKYMTNLVSQNGLDYVCYGHAGNSHLHLNMLPKDEGEYNKAKSLYGEICAKAIELKGTISAEHGIGKLKRNYLSLMYSDDHIKQMSQIKKQLDPALILGIGNMIDPKYFNNSELN